MINLGEIIGHKNINLTFKNTNEDIGNRFPSDIDDMDGFYFM